MARNRQTGGTFMLTGSLMQSKREPTPGETVAINEVYELVDRFAAGMTTTAEIRAATSGKQRWLATRFTEPKHRLFKPLMRMLDALIADEGRFATKHGDFEPDDLYTTQAKIVREEGRDLIQFPVLYPWLVKPDPDKGTEGIPKPPVYRDPEQRGAVLGSFRVKPLPELKPYEPEFWEIAEGDEVVPTPITATNGEPF